MKFLFIGLIMFGFFSCNEKKSKNDSLESEQLSALVDSITKYPNCEVFEIENSNGTPLEWTILPTNLKIIPNTENHFLVKANIVSQNNIITVGYINLSTPERISDYLISDLDKPKVIRFSELKNRDIIPTVASDCFGLYELYYSKRNPQIGIETLKKGLELSNEKSVIAEDIAYILRDENRLNEALEYFLISEQFKPSSEYILGEIEDIYKAQGNDKKAEEYRLKLEQD